MATTKTNTNTNTETRKHYYIALLETETNEVRFVPNTPKGRATLQDFKTPTTKAFRVGAMSINEAYNVFKNETGIECELVNIVYHKNIPVVKEIDI